VKTTYIYFRNLTQSADKFYNKNSLTLPEQQLASYGFAFAAMLVTLL